MSYDPVNFSTIIAIISYITLFTFGFLSGKRYLISKNRIGFRLKQYILDRERGLRLLFLITITLSYICIICMFLKVKDQSGRYGISLSLKGLSELRGATLDDNSYELGSSFYGMVASTLFGFPILCGVFATVYKELITSRRRKLLWITFLIGIAASMLTGGRFMAFTFALFYYFTIKIVSTEINVKQTSFQKIFLAASGILLFWVFAQMFLDRMGVRSISFAIYFLPLCTPKLYTTYLLQTFPGLDTLIALFSYFEYYVAHGVNQLDILLNAPYPANAPYWGGYELSTFFLFFKKIGLDVITTDTIVAEIVNPGVYFTHIGALFLDFGIWVSAFVVFAFGYLSGNSWTKFRAGAAKLSLVYLNIIILSLVSFAPIVSLVSAGYFPAIIVSYFVLVIFENFVALPLYKSSEPTP